VNDLKTDAGAASEECGCAPTPAERRALWPARTVTRRAALAVGALGALGIGAFSVSSGITAAYAADYPSWDDVQRAKANEAAKGAEISRIQTLIQQLTADVAAKEAAAKVAGDEFFAAQQAYLEQAAVADELQSQADAQAKVADETAKKAGQVATQLYRNGGDDTALELFFSGSAEGADSLLSRLGGMDKLLEYNRTVYENAVAARDQAQSLTDQAKAARDERDRLQKLAEEKMVKAQQAADAAAAALAAKQANLSTLQAQLAALQDTTAKTVAAYQEGERIRKAEEERKRRAAEAARRAAEEAARKAREEAAKNNSGGGGSGGSGGGGTGGSGGASGWVRPHGGRISSGYGPRGQQCTSGYCSSHWHLGLDFANGCGAPIFAAAAGTVVYAGYNGGFGNYVKLRHGGGVGTGYGHMSHIAVGYGQSVRMGQVIGYAGNTGNSFGCHLHFEVYPSGGGTTNPYNWLAARGAL